MTKTLKIGSHKIFFNGVFNGVTLLGLGFSFNPDGEDITFAAHLFPFGGFITIRGNVIGWFYKKLKIKSCRFGRNFGFGLSKGGIFNIDCGLMSKDMAKSLIYFDLAEILGKEIYKEIDRDKGEMEIEMPEGRYKAEYRAFTSFWTRKFGFTSKLGRISIKLKDKIPMPPPDDPVHGVTMPFPETQDLVDAKIAFINSISHRRYKVGGKDWIPNSNKPNPQKLHDVLNKINI